MAGRISLKKADQKIRDRAIGGLYSWFCESPARIIELSEMYNAVKAYRANDDKDDHMMVDELIDQYSDELPISDIAGMEEYMQITFEV